MVLEQMSDEELVKLARIDKNKASETIIKRYDGTIKKIIRKYIFSGNDDLYQVGSLALIYAIDRYDISKGYEFSSFATPTIIGEIKKYFRDKVWTLKVPRRIQELSKKISEAKLILEQENKRHPRAKDIAEYFKDELNLIELEKLQEAGVCPVWSNEKKEGVFSGQTVVLTGTLSSYKRSEAQKLIEERGGTCLSSVTQKTTLVIAGEEAGSKLDKANALGVKVINEAEFNDMIK